LLASPAARMSGRRVPVLLALVPLLAAGTVATVVPSSGAQDLGDLQSKAQQRRASEQALKADIAHLGRLLNHLQRDIAIVERRRAEVQQELDADRAKLAQVRDALREQRARVQRLRRRLRQAQTVLANRLVELYKSPPPDLISVVLTSHGFAELLDRAEFIRRIGDQDQRIILNVRRAKGDAKAAVARLADDERQQVQVTNAIQARSNALAGISASLNARQAAYTQARAARAAALRSTHADRLRLEKQISKLEAQRARLAGASSGGPWSIPWPIVQCESGGQNLPPNSAGASGYYQIIPGTWRLFGGTGPQAYLRPKAEQDAVAARIWNGGRGASNWVCAALVAGG
jgi:peptidoglycan hydrolase CwlO-like protein